MKIFIALPFVFIFSLFSNSISALTLSEDAAERGINSVCISYLSQIENSYDLDGALNITFAYPDDASMYPSLHISSKKYSNGSSTFTATLSPDNEYCYVSASVITSINNQSCSEISLIKSENDPSIILSEYADGGFIIITPADNSYQTILTVTGNNSCTMSETRMLWPGR